MKIEDLLTDFVAVGGSLDEFWRMTPRLYVLYMTGKNKELVREEKNRTELAWKSAALSRAKKLPDLYSILGEKKPRKMMKPEHVRAHLHAMTAHMPRKKVLKK